MDIIKQMLSQSLSVQDAPNVCFEAVKALTAFLTTNEGEASIVHHFRDLLPGVIQVSFNDKKCAKMKYLCDLELTGSIK